MTHDDIINALFAKFNEYGQGVYLGEPVTLTEHMLQTAYAAEQDGAGPTLIAAAVVHDFGHFVHDLDEDSAQHGVDTVHEEAGAAYLSRYFSVPETCTLVCDVRTLSHQDEVYVAGELDRLLVGLEGVTHQLRYTAVPSASPADTTLAASIRRVMHAASGRDDIAWLPAPTLGFTDSRVVRPLGTITYGFSPDHPDADPAIPANFHAPNESIDIASLLYKTKFFAGLAVDLSGE